MDKPKEELGCEIYYSPSDLPAGKRISQMFNEASVSMILKELWGEEQIIIRAGTNDISIRQKPSKKVENNKGKLTGRLTDTKHNPIPGATIQIKGTTTGNITDSDGRYVIPNLEAGTYTLIISSLGFQRTERTIKIIGGKTIDLKTTLQEQVDQLDEVVVFGKTETQEKMEQPIKVEAMNLEAIQERSTPVAQLINQMPGVNIRLTAGVGSSVIVNLNGLQGRAIRYFRDGVPLDYLGRAFDLSIVPIGQLGGLEVYKGVLPGELGADALGGAINFNSAIALTNQLDVSYGFGSFNTHQANINAYYQIPNSKLFTRLTSYYVYSDNDYEMEVEVVDQENTNFGSCQSRAVS
ncbi:MAG: TonB-dependent receptor [Bacteroidota bacterium]